MVSEHKSTCTSIASKRKKKKSVFWGVGSKNSPYYPSTSSLVLIRYANRGSLCEVDSFSNIRGPKQWLRSPMAVLFMSQYSKAYMGAKKKKRGGGVGSDSDCHGNTKTHLAKHVEQLFQQSPWLICQFLQP